MKRYLERMHDIVTAYPDRTALVDPDRSLPMNVVWRLSDEIPAKYLKQTRKMLVG